MLFKYTKYSRAIDILKTGKVRFTQPSDFNDPFELRPEFQLLSQEDIAALPPVVDADGNEIPGSHILTTEVMQRIMAPVVSYIERKSPPAPNTLGLSYLIDNNAIGRDYYDQNFGIFSLTETHDNLLMWAHYADYHKGVTLGFDEQHPFFSGPEIAPNTPRLNRVEYNSKRPVISLATKNTPQVFLRKSPEWSYEREWRVVRPLSEASEVVPREGLAPIYIFDVPVAAIKIVITGAMMAADEYQNICSYCASSEATKHISLHHMQLSKEEYTLDTFPPYPAISEEQRQRLLAGKALSAKPFTI